jgi:hypothetical protein
MLTGKTVIWARESYNDSKGSIQRNDQGIRRLGVSMNKVRGKQAMHDQVALRETPNFLLRLWACEVVRHVHPDHDCVLQFSKTVHQAYQPYKSCKLTFIFPKCYMHLVIWRLGPSSKLVITWSLRRWFIVFKWQGHLRISPTAKSTSVCPELKFWNTRTRRSH